MRAAGPILVVLPMMLTVVSVMARAQESLLPLVLPRKTFYIHDTRFPPTPTRRTIGGPRAPMRWPLPYPSRPVKPQEDITTRQPTRVPQVPTPSQQRFAVQQSGFSNRVPQTSAPRRQTALQQTNPQRAPSAQNQFRPTPSTFTNQIPQRNIGGRPAGRHHMCGVLPDAGDCRAAFPRYFYNNQTDQCDCFLYGGCGPSGLEYSYQTLEQCQAMCLPGNLEEGPVCEEIFREEEVYYDDVPASPPQQTPNTDHISDEAILSLLINAVSPEDFVDYNSDNEDENNHRRSLNTRYF